MLQKTIQGGDNMSGTLERLHKRAYEMTGVLEKVFRVYSNKEIEPGIKLCRDLFRRAKESIKIVAGRVSHEFYDDPRIVEVLENAANRRPKGVTIEIIYGPKFDPESTGVMTQVQQKMASCEIQ
jgi:hypothetical protein